MPHRHQSRAASDKCVPLWFVKKFTGFVDGFDLFGDRQSGWLSHSVLVYSRIMTSYGVMMMNILPLLRRLINEN